MLENRVFIIAEAGVNHNGDINLAYRLVDEAANAGADAVKFQTFITDKGISKHAIKADYQQRAGDTDKYQLEMIKRLELSFEDFIKIKQYCDAKKILFLSTPFDFDSIEFLNNLGMQIFKIPSGEINNLPYLRKVGEYGKKIILSTGMATLGEIETALGVLRQSGTSDIIVLHCTTEYPTPMEEVNINAMLTIRDAFKVKVGYSDHTLGIEVPIAAVALGAQVIEKHFTLDKNMEGPDHRASLEPEELNELVKCIRNIERAMGEGIKRPSNSELKNKDIVRKSIVAGCDIKEGQELTTLNLAVKRPGNGISPMRWDEVVGKVAIRDFKEDELIEL